MADADIEALTARDFWDDVAAATQDVSGPPANAITLQEFMDRAHVNAYRARLVLMRLVQEGRVKTCIYGKLRYWWPVEPEAEP